MFFRTWRAAAAASFHVHYLISERGAAAAPGASVSGGRRIDRAPEIKVQVQMAGMLDLGFDSKFYFKPSDCDRPWFSRRAFKYRQDACGCRSRS